MPQSSGSDETKSFGKNLEDVQIGVPIVYGSTSFWLGEKANQEQTHKWTVYVRSALYEDLGVVIKRVVFRLHPSFDNPVRVVKSPPFELSGSTCGEFDVCIRLVFHKYVCSEKLDLIHHLKLYPEDEYSAWSTKNPVVAEAHDEILFTEPFKGFYARVQNHPAVVPRRYFAKYPLVNEFLMNCTDTFNLIRDALVPKEVDAEKNYYRKQVQQLQQQVQGIQLLEYNDHPDDSDDEVSTDEEDLNPFYRQRVKGVFSPDSDTETELPEPTRELPAIDLKAPPVFDDYEELNPDSKPIIPDSRSSVRAFKIDRELTFCDEEVLLSQVHQFVKFQDGKADKPDKVTT